MPTYMIKLMRRETVEDEIAEWVEHVQDEELLHRMRQFLMEPYFDKTRYYLIVEVE